MLLININVIEYKFVEIFSENLQHKLTWNYEHLVNVISLAWTV